MLENDKQSAMARQTEDFNPMPLDTIGGIALDGKLTLNAGQLQDKLQQIKARTQCYDCGQKGHWRGDKTCPKGSSSSAGSSKGGKKGAKEDFSNEQVWLLPCWLLHQAN